MSRSEIITIGVAGLIVVIVLSHIDWAVTRFGRQSAQQPTLPLQAADVQFIEEALALKLPGAQAIEELALLVGQDSMLYTKLVMSPEAAAELLDVVRARSKPYDPTWILTPTPDVPWFTLDKASVADAFSDGKGGVVIFSVPQAGKVYILTYSQSTVVNFPAGLYDIFD